MSFQTIEADLCIIGGGVGGLTMASVSAQLGLNVVLFEGHKMGGDCLNYGCVPSKSLLAAGHAAKMARDGGAAFGIHSKDINVDMKEVHDHIHGVIKSIEPHDSPARFEKMGVNVIQDYAKFIDHATVEGGGMHVRARKFVIATGSAPAIPHIEGLKDAPYLTNETIFNLTIVPTHLIIIGGGPIGCEMAQAFHHLGADVSIVSLSTILPHDDSDAVEIVRGQFQKDGINLYEGAETTHIAASSNDILVKIKTAEGQIQTLTGSHLLIATGRKPNLDKLDLHKAGVTFDPQGIKVNHALRTTNKRIYAAGDCVGPYQFTHIAEYHAGVIIQKVLFKSPFAKVDDSALPWVTYTAPELANIGLNEVKAREKYGADNIKVCRFDYADNDRARAERATNGFIKVITKPNGHVLGATIVGKNAGELILPWSLAIAKKMKLSDIAQRIVPYPTYNEISKRAAGSFYKDKLFSNLTKKMVGLLKHI